MNYDGRIIDVHTHIQPASVITDRRPYVETEPDFKILYENPKYRLASGREVVSQMDQYGVDVSVILGFAWRNPQLLRIHNDTILNDSAASRGRLSGFTCVYPFVPGAAAEADRCLKAGAAGIGEIGLYDRDLDAEYIDSMAPVMAVCRDYGRPVMMHVNEPVGHSYSGKAPISIRGIYNFVKTYPDNRIILAHWGGGLFFYHTLKKEAKELLANVWYDSAASPYIYDGSIWKTAVEIVGAEKILFATDFPLLNAGRYITELDESGLSSSEIECICYRNAQTLLGI